MQEQLKISILDGFTANPGDTSWAGLEALGNVTVYDRTASDQIIERSQGAAAIFTNKVPISAETIAQLPDLKFIGVLATGYNIIDLEAAAARGITVSNVPGYSTDSVAQLTFGLILDLSFHAAAHSQAVHNRAWETCEDFCFTVAPLTELAGKTLGVVGYGTIGQQVAAIGKAFGLNVIAYNRTESKVPAEIYTPLEDLLKQSDIVTLHCPLTPDTADLIDAASLDLMKPNAWLINTSRGPLVNEIDLADALKNGTIAAAGLDVLRQEPMVKDHTLLGLQNCLITPHIAWATRESRARLIDQTVKNLEAWISAAPINTVA